ncbi:MHYT domain-containing protein, NO-binding membrane sensor [Micromonospora phaseoli]|uniref:MHYT domain-containing protein, NO-binding membrane sensor n=1 Tax=Micromonospora phaseoli TaxID=1144548 RepID=A0A1H6YM87_9ACTN|nr:MHYT domain-containing protein [Micromonospora phaseoli]PZW00180.1 NO-binding membrane sensor protein with MHYT domain [Micromonospora phaseoli]GIJ78886.1 membrane protein [Micromonospora phaseoli]SEJ40057.1 MHYT domain-containing protein, NO-binding membrane sensor [Micromonospora phaseoli]
MADINHFEYGWITPALSYALSVLGSILGLVCATRIRAASSTGQKVWWGTLAAWAIGGTAIWTMHFMAMLGFAVSGSRIRYDVPITVASALLAVLAVGIGLAIVGTGRLSAVRIVAGGLFTGSGVAAMHYSGMAAMRLDGDLSYDNLRVGLSVLIAVVAATVALWLAVTVRRGLAILGSALVMGVAVNGMHFTGMSALSVHLHEERGEIVGAGVGTLLIPIVLLVIFGVVGLVYALLAAPTDEDRAAAAYLDARQTPTAAGPPDVTAPDPVGLRARSTLARPGAQFPSRRDHPPR